MADAPERITVQIDHRDGTWGRWSTHHAGDQDVEYVRADLLDEAEIKIRQLEANLATERDIRRCEQGLTGSPLSQRRP